MVMGMLVTALLSSEAAGGVGTWTLFAVFTVLHLYCNYRAISSVRLQTFNRYKCSIFISHFVQTEKLLSPKEVASREQLLWFDSERPSILVGVQLREIVGSDAQLLEKLLKRYKDEKYIVHASNGSICIALQHEASPSDILKAYFQSVYLRHILKDPKYPTEDVKIATSYKYINAHFRDWMTKLAALGWVTDRCMLGPSEWRFTVHK